MHNIAPTSITHEMQKELKNIFALASFSDELPQLEQLSLVYKALATIEEGFSVKNFSTGEIEYFLPLLEFTASDLVWGNPMVGSLDCRHANTPCRNCTISSKDLYKSKLDYIPIRLTKELELKLRKKHYASSSWTESTKNLAKYGLAALPSPFILFKSLQREQVRIYWWLI
jgi:hypothetical protein